ncbi:hotdog fold thioesterase [Halovenus sp. WSH3]|uniref:Hotdog fold thioesterase n=1 Tax=Halovenus carboxidivorans TaxID=2692199 RepID=A0A6B0T6V9_9EURY|nr:PaaI family thioesterase [Halovenus carboxidivorans]MXR51012.1 hotdog fold thioesterase [Halovenus carboxidivorans]
MSSAITDLFNQMPYAKLLGIEVTEAGDGYAEGVLPFDDDLRSNPYGEVAHGGATYALADTIGGAAVISLTEDVSPTIDMRIDYLAPVKRDIYASAEVIRHGSDVSLARVEIEDSDGTQVATAQGTYKTGGQGNETDWDGERGSERFAPESE